MLRFVVSRLDSEMIEQRVGSKKGYAEYEKARNTACRCVARTGEIHVIDLIDIMGDDSQYHERVDFIEPDDLDVDGE